MKVIKSYFGKWISESMFDKIMAITIALFIILLVLFLIKKGITKKLDDSAKKYRAKKIANAFAYSIIIISALFIFSDDVGNIGVAVGLAGAGIAFALQEVIVSFASWLNIMFTNQIKVGQRVKIGHIKGDIIDIGVLKTTIMEVGDWVNGDLYNGRITSISNSFVFKEPIQNYSADYPFLWDEIEVPLKTNSDFVYAREVLNSVVNDICGKYAQGSKVVWKNMQDKYQLENAKVDPLVTMTFDQNWITFTVRYVVNYSERRTIKDKLYTRILQEINDSDEKLIVATTAMEVTTKPMDQN